MADGGAASQDESSGPGNDYSILHIHTHIQTVLVAIYDKRNADETYVERGRTGGRCWAPLLWSSARRANSNLTEEETGYCGATANFMETCLPPLCD